MASATAVLLSWTGPMARVGSTWKTPKNQASRRDLIDAVAERYGSNQKAYSKARTIVDAVFDDVAAVANKYGFDATESNIAGFKLQNDRGDVVAEAYPYVLDASSAARQAGYDAEAFGHDAHHVALRVPAYEEDSEEVGKHYHSDEESDDAEDSDTVRDKRSYKGRRHRNRHNNKGHGYAYGRRDEAPASPRARRRGRWVGMDIEEEPFDQPLEIGIELVNRAPYKYAGGTLPVTRLKAGAMLFTGTDGRPVAMNFKTKKFPTIATEEGSSDVALVGEVLETQMANSGRVGTMITSDHSHYHDKDSGMRSATSLLFLH